MFRRNAERMSFQGLRAQEFFVGSQEAERTVIGSRLKRSDCSGPSLMPCDYRSAVFLPQRPLRGLLARTCGLNLINFVVQSPTSVALPEAEPC